MPPPAGALRRRARRGPLKALLAATDISYYEYMELRNAVEALGGEVVREREFYGDPDYEYLRELE